MKDETLYSGWPCYSSPHTVNPKVLLPLRNKKFLALVDLATVYLSALSKCGSNTLAIGQVVSNQAFPFPSKSSEDW